MLSTVVVQADLEESRCVHYVTLVATISHQAATCCDIERLHWLVIGHLQFSNQLQL